MEDWDAPKHQWPSQELVAALGQPESENPKRMIVHAVWNSIAQFRSIAYMIEGGYLLVADGQGNLHQFFSGHIYPAVGLPAAGAASTAFGRLIVRDLTLALSATGEPYGPEGTRSAYLALDSGGQLNCVEDMLGRQRRSFGVRASQLKVA